jgi:sarcosine oxidase
MSAHYHSIVLGVGSMGAATCYYLARQGHRVLGLEQFEISHDRGSHTGQSRIVRKAYFEHPDYVPLLNRAYDNWAQLETETGADLFLRNGLLYAGDPDSILMKGIHTSASLYQIPVEVYDNESIKKVYPQFKVQQGCEVIVERDAGLVNPEKSVLLFAQQAIRHGAEIHTHEKAGGWEIKNGVVQVSTDKGTYTADHLIITAGPWAGDFIPQIRKELHVTRQTIAWFMPSYMRDFYPENFPCWLIQDSPGDDIFYGFPVLPVQQFGGPMGLKIAQHNPGTIVNPDSVDRHVTTEETEKLHHAINSLIPRGAGRLVTSKTCLYTYSPDENFIIDFLPGTDQKVVVACGFSGHGFKFVPAIGDILSDLVTQGETDLPVGFLSLARLLK